MATSSIYRLQGPSEWPMKPDSFSFSSLAAIQVCPLQWQLVHARYQGLAQFPARPNPSAVEGNIVHRTLELLFKSLAIAGLPAVGTIEFRREVARVDVKGTVRRLIADHGSKIATHPRRSGFRLRAGSNQLINQVIRLFRAEYAGGARSRPPHQVRAPRVRPKSYQVRTSSSSYTHAAPLVKFDFSTPPCLSSESLIWYARPTMASSSSTSRLGSASRFIKHKS